MTTGETLFLALTIATFVGFAIMLAYHDHQYRATKRETAARPVNTRDAARSNRAHA